MKFEPNQPNQICVNVRKLNARIDSNPFRNACRNTQTQTQIHMAFDFGFNRNLTGILLEWFLRIFEIHLARFHIALERSRPAHVNYFMFYLLLANSNCCWMRIQQRRALMITNHWNVTIQLGLSSSCSDLYRCEIYCARAFSFSTNLVHSFSANEPQFLPNVNWDQYKLQIEIIMLLFVGTHTDYRYTSIKMPVQMRISRTQHCN